jgi:hypothetical protein
VVDRGELLDPYPYRHGLTLGDRAISRLLELAGRLLVKPPGDVPLSDRLLTQAVRLIALRVRRSDVGKEFDPRARSIAPPRLGSARARAAAIPSPRVLVPARALAREHGKAEDPNSLDTLIAVRRSARALVWHPGPRRTVSLNDR